MPTHISIRLCDPHEKLYIRFSKRKQCRKVICIGGIWFCRLVCMGRALCCASVFGTAPVHENGVLSVRDDVSSEQDAEIQSQYVVTLVHLCLVNALLAQFLMNK